MGSWQIKKKKKLKKKTKYYKRDDDTTHTVADKTVNIDLCDP